MTVHVAVAAHADWSVDPRKRWISIARRTAAGWHLDAPAPVGDVASLLGRLLALADGGPVALGVDLPIGLPRAYAALHADTADFPGFLRTLADRPDFFDVASTLAEVDPLRPFYPARGIAGMTRDAHARALGLAGRAELCRACDRATATRPAGAPLFWTLGANQSGKAAIAAWRDMLIPALRGPCAPRLWPFDGDLLTLLTPGALVVAETYPAEALRHIGARLQGSKRAQAPRRAVAPCIDAAMAQLSVTPGDTMARAIADGFGADPAGEDRFDSTVGVLCVLGVLAGQRPDGIPDDPWLRRWEGWVLGQTDPPLPVPHTNRP